tara:strand:+ start:1172 stop:1648 length:477 start_codon:yes stop_codon:yes gene_type:complete
MMADENIELELEEQLREDAKKRTGEWAICSLLVFLGVVLVLVLSTTLNEYYHLDKSKHIEFVELMTKFFQFNYTDTNFPIDLAAIVLLISIMSAFCGLISLVADKNNRNTWLVRAITLGPLLPIFMSVLMILIIINRTADTSIMQDIIGGGATPAEGE